MRYNADLFFFPLFHHIAIMPTCSRSLVEPLAFKTEPYKSKKAEKNTLRHTHNTYSALRNVQSPPYHHSLSPSAQTLCSLLFLSITLYLPGEHRLPFFFRLHPSLILFLSLKQSLTIEVKEDKQSLSADIWSSWTQFGTVHGFFTFYFLCRGTGGEKNEQIVNLSFVIWLRSTSGRVEYYRTD